jgi:exonuclease VII large subunit
MEELLRALSPQSLLERGYAYVEDAGTMKPIRSAEHVRPGSLIRAHLADGQFTATVNDTQRNPDTLNHNGEQA